MSLIRIAQHSRCYVCKKHRHLLSFVYPSSSSFCWFYVTPDGFTNPVSSASPYRKFSAETYNQYFSKDSPPIALTQSFLEEIHDITGLPWWASIPLTAFTLRTFITLPFTLYSNYIISRVERLQPEIQELSNRLKWEVSVAKKKFHWSESKAKLKYAFTMKNLVRDLYIRDNCHPMKCSVVILVQLPLWLSISFALRNMSGAGLSVTGGSPILCPSLVTEGIFWFTNLTVPDTTWILPIMLGVFNLMIIEINALQKANPSRFQRFVTNFLRGISIIMVPVGASVPSSMCLYWVSSSMYGLAQNIILRLPSVSKIFPSPKSYRSETPFQDMLKAAQIKYSFKKKS